MEAYPKQALWLFTSVVESTKPNRKTRGKIILDQLSVGTHIFHTWLYSWWSCRVTPTTAEVKPLRWSIRQGPWPRNSSPYVTILSTRTRPPSAWARTFQGWRPWRTPAWSSPFRNLWLQVFHLPLLMSQRTDLSHSMFRHLKANSLLSMDLAQASDKPL